MADVNRFDHRQLAPAVVINPNDAIRSRSLTNEPVGGGVVRLGQAAPGMPVPQERGLTFPYTVLNISQEMRPVDYDRKFFFAQNNDPLGVVFISFGGAAAALNQGIRLGPAGGGIFLDINVPTARIFAIGTIASNPNVTIITG